MNQNCNDIKELTTTEVQELLGVKENPPLLIDVRQPEEYAAGHIPGALLFPLGQVELARPLLDQSRPVVVYCRSGKRSLMAARILCRLGFPQVFSLAGGILGWQSELLKGMPQEKIPISEANTVLDIMLLAMEKEMAAQQLYKTALSNGHKPELNALLDELANREEKHLSSIYQRYLDWTIKHALPQKSLEMIKQEAMSALEQQALPDFDSPEDLLELAVQQELAAYDFYRTSAEQLKDPELRGILFDLSFEERSHAAALLELVSQLSK